MLLAMQTNECRERYIYIQLPPFFFLNYLSTSANQFNNKPRSISFSNEPSKQATARLEKEVTETTDSRHSLKISPTITTPHLKHHQIIVQRQIYPRHRLHHHQQRKRKRKRQRSTWRSSLCPPRTETARRLTRRGTRRSGAVRSRACI